MKKSSSRLEQQNLLLGSEMHAVLTTTPPLFFKIFQIYSFSLTAKKKAAKHKKHETGGGPPPPPFNTSDKAVLEIIGQSPIMASLSENTSDTPVLITATSNVQVEDDKACMGEIQAEPSTVASALNSDMSVDLADLLASVAPQKHENIIEGNRHLELAFA